MNRSEFNFLVLIGSVTHATVVAINRWMLLSISSFDIRAFQEVFPTEVRSPEIAIRVHIRLIKARSIVKYKFCAWVSILGRFKHHFLFYLQAGLLKINGLV
jgi:hypothetical protein